MAEPAKPFRFGAFTLNPAERLLLKENRVVPLAPKAFDLLTMMVRNHGRLLSKDELIKEVWPDTFIEESNLAYNVFAIRKALGEGADEQRFIETVPRHGYRFVALVDLSDDSVGATMAVPRLQEPAVVALDAGTSLERGLGTVAPSTRRSWVAGSVATAAAIALVALVIMYSRGTPSSGPLLRAQIPIPVRLLDANPFAISPDGLHLAYVGVGSDGVARLWVQELDKPDPRPVSGTDSGVSIVPPFWSPDSAFIAYDGGGQLMKVGVSGGAPQRVCSLQGPAVGGAWYGTAIVVGNSRGGLMTCPVSGVGTASPVTNPSTPSGDEIHIFPSFLPDGQHLLYTKVSRTAPESSGIFVASLVPGDAGGGSNRLLQTGFGSAFVDGGDSRGGQILFVRDGTLFAQGFDALRRTLAPEGPIRVASPVGSFVDFAYFSVSASGRLVFKAPDPDVQLTWFDRHQRVVSLVGEPCRCAGVTLSPDGTRAVAVKYSPKSTVDQDLWLFELSPNPSSRKLTSAPLLERAPVWLSDNDRIIFSGGLSGVYEMSVTSPDPPRRLFRTGHSEDPVSVSRDLRWLLLGTASHGGRGGDLWTYPLNRGRDVEPQSFLRRQLNQGQGQFSPDGHWVAYVSNESGPPDVFVAPVLVEAATDTIRAGSGEQLSKGGGGSPRWSRDGGQLFYLAFDGTVMVVQVRTDRGISASPPAKLFPVPGALPDWGVSPDGTRFLLAVPVRSPPPFDVIQNWQVALRR